MFRFAPVRKSVDDEVVWRIVQTDVQAMEHFAQCLGKETLLIGRQGTKVGLMAFGKDQGLEGEARSVRRQRHECLVLEDEAITSLLFLFQHRAVDTHSVLAEVTLRGVEL